MRTRAARVCAALAACACILSGLPAQNRNHPGLVYLGENRWGSEEAALAKGLFEYRGRWLPKKMHKRLRKWERQDKRSIDWKDAYKIKSKHYRITTNVPHFIMELEILPYLDALYDTYIKVFKEDFGLKGKGANKKFIKIHFGFESYSRVEGRPRTNPGFIRNHNELTVFYDETEPEQFYYTTFHEGSHQFFAAMLPGAALPLWLTEALATYFEGCTYSRATKKITIGHLPPVRLGLAQNMLRRSPAAPDLAERLFMDLPRGQFRAQQYALAWSFIYYLVNREQGAHHKDLALLLKEMNGGGAKSVARQFKTATKKDLAEIAPGWRDYVLGLKVPPSPEWVTLRVQDAGGTDLKNKDIIWSFDGVEVYRRSQLIELIKARPMDRPFEIRVIRRTKIRDPKIRFRAEFRSVTVAVGSKLLILPGPPLIRRHSLLD